jgi:hypothetical protein
MTPLSDSALLWLCIAVCGATWRRGPGSVVAEVSNGGDATMRLLMTVSVLPLLVVGCIQGLLDEAAGLSPDPETSPSSESTSTGEPPSPTTSMGSGVQTVTGPPDETTEAVETTTAPGTSTGAPEENVPPTVKLKVEPSYLSEAGKALLWLCIGSA